MKKQDVTIGGRYHATVSDKRVEVRIDAENSHGGWDATNLATGKKIRIKTAQRLRGEVGKAKRRAAEPVPEVAEVAAPECPRGGQHEWTEDEGERSCRKCGEPAPAPGERKGKRITRAKASAPPRDKKLSALDAAAKLLAETGETMGAKEIIAALEAKGYWKSPGGKTPHATLYSAIIRELDAKGEQARFVKTERGRFAARKS